MNYKALPNKNKFAFILAFMHFPMRYLFSLNYGFSESQNGLNCLLY